MKKIPLLIILTIFLTIFPKICVSLNFSETVLKNSIRISEKLYVQHINDPINSPVGSGFIFKDNNNKNYLVTANHVLKAIKSNEIVAEKYGNEYIDQRIVSIQNYKFHPEQDIAIVEINQFQATILEKNLDLAEEVNFGDYGENIGYPRGTFEARLRGGLLSFNVLKPLSEIFFDARIQHGESGSPVFVSSTQKIVGIVISKEEDKDIANVVPIHFIKDIMKVIND